MKIQMSDSLKSQFNQNTKNIFSPHGALDAGMYRGIWVNWPFKVWVNLNEDYGKGAGG